jgi:hypothetical protein
MKLLISFFLFCSVFITACIFSSKPDTQSPGNSSDISVQKDTSGVKSSTTVINPPISVDTGKIKNSSTNPASGIKEVKNTRLPDLDTTAVN